MANVRPLLWMVVIQLVMVVNFYLILNMYSSHWLNVLAPIVFGLTLSIWSFAVLIHTIVTTYAGLKKEEEKE